MTQTHLLKLEPPYRFIFDEKKGRVGKVIAALLKVNGDAERDCTVSVPIVDLADTWDDTDLSSCQILCDEFNPRISFERYIGCLMSVPWDAWLPNGLFSVYSFGLGLSDQGIRVMFPGEGEKEGEQELTIETELYLGFDEGEYWVENAFGGFYFNGRYKSREALQSFILGRRNDYYRSFPRKRFTIRLSTDNAEFQNLLDDINDTPYVP